MTAKPIRLQLSRAKGFSLQGASWALNGRAAVNVARPSRWGNPFIVGQPSGIFDGKDGRPLGMRDQAEILIPALSLEQAIEFYRNALEGFIKPEMYPAGHRYRDRIRHSDLRFHLRGKNLACWCKPGAPCHADVLLEIANA